MDISQNVSPTKRTFDEDCNDSEQPEVVCQEMSFPDIVKQAQLVDEGFIEDT